MHSILSQRRIEIAKPGRHADGGGLFLNVTPAGVRTWAFVYRSPVHRVTRGNRVVGRQREAGLGVYPDVTLADARDIAAAWRKLIAAKDDPLDARNADRAARVAAAAKAAAKAAVPTFGAMAESYIATKAPRWRNSKTAAHWRNSLRVHAKALASMPVDVIETGHVVDVLTPIWHTHPETAKLTRARIEAVLDVARVRGHRAGENPARWKGHLQPLLGARPRLSRGHHRALPWPDVPGFVRRLRGEGGAGARALEFAILTACRSGEVRGARWSEFDMRARVWTIPAGRMKMGVEHRVPLTPRMLAILDEVAPLRGDGDLVFPGMRPGRPLSDMTLLVVLRRMAVPSTVHGFRACFRTWAGNNTASPWPRELAELALAHSVGDAVEQAYQRETALERRRPMMAAWEGFIEAGAG